MSQSEYERLITLFERTLKEVQNLADIVCLLEKRIDSIVGEEKPKIVH